MDSVLKKVLTAAFTALTIAGGVYAGLLLWEMSEAKSEELTSLP